MKLITKILFATDFLHSFENDLQHALAVAKKFDAEIFPIHVLPDSVKDEKARRLLSEAATKELDQLCRRIEAANLSAGDPILEFGVHYDNIVAAADRLDANFIMIGAGQKPADDPYPLGTTAEKIIRNSDKPVWVIKPDQPFALRTLLCPVDYSKESALALSNALVLARRFEARLVILTVFEKRYGASRGSSPDWEAVEAYWQDVEDQEEKAYLEQFEAFLKDFNLQGLEVERKIVIGQAAPEILRTIGKLDADLLIMGTTGRSGLSRLMMGSVTEKVIRTLPCSFITTKAKGVIQLQLAQRLQDIEIHHANGKQLMEDGFFQEAIAEFKTCLEINDMHVPSLFGIAKVYDRLGEEEPAARYRKMAREVMLRIWDAKIEEEVRKFYK